MLVLSRASCSCAARDDARVGVAHERDVVVGVEVRAPGLVVEVLRPAAHDLERPAVRDGEVPTEQAPARGQSSPRASGPRRGKRCAGTPRRRLGSGERLVQSARWLGRATPGKSASRPSRSRITWKWRWGGQSPFVGGAPTRAIAWPASTVWPTARPWSVSSRQVAVEGEEGRAVRGLVAEDDDRPVVLRRRVVREGVDDARQRGADRRPRLDEEVDPEVDRPPLVAWLSPARRRATGRSRAPRRSAPRRSRPPPAASRRRPAPSGGRSRRPRGPRRGRGCPPRGPGRGRASSAGRRRGREPSPPARATRRAPGRGGREGARRPPGTCSGRSGGGPGRAARARPTPGPRSP